MDEIKTYDVVVLGGGFSGLLGALYLGDKNLDVAVFEKKSKTGGFLRTLDFAGSKFDLGGHRLVFAKEKLLKSILERIGFADELLVKKKKAGIYLFCRELDYPPTLKDIFAFPVIEILSIMKELFFTRFKHRHPKNFEGWVKLHYGESIYNLVFKGYTKKVWGINAEKLPATWLAKRIGYFKFLNLFFGIPCVFSKDTQDKFLYPKHGIGVLADAMASTVSKNSDVFSSSSVSKISKLSEGGYMVEYDDSKKHKRIVKCNKILSTIPLTEFIAMIGEKKQFSSDALRYRHIVFLNMVLKKDAELPKAQWLYIPQEDIIFSRVYNIANWSDALCKKGTASISMEIIGGDEIMDYDIDFLREQALLAFKRLEINICEDDLLECYLVREKHAYPLSVGNDKAVVDGMKNDIAAKYPGVCFAGRMGEHVYLDTEDCVLSVQSALENF